MRLVTIISATLLSKREPDLSQPHPMRHTAAEFANIDFAVADLTCESGENQERPAGAEVTPCESDE
jgi:hypothetical protein